MGHGGGCRELGGRSVLGGFRGRAVHEVGREAAGHERAAGGTGVEGAANGPAGDSGGDGGKAGGSGSCGRTGRDAWGPVCLSPPGQCGAGWRGEGCGR